MEITLAGLIVALIIGAIAGWLAGQIVKGSGFGLWGNVECPGLVASTADRLDLQHLGIHCDVEVRRRGECGGGGQSTDRQSR